MNIKFKHFPSVKSMMVFEKEFEPELRNSYREKKELIADMDEVIAGYIDGELFFEWYGGRIGCGDTVYDEPINPGQPDYPEFGYKNWDTSTTFYCCSNGLLKKYQNKGLGTICKAYTLGYLKGLKYEWIVGHANKEGSLQLNLRFGAKAIHSFTNWYGTGSTYVLYSIKL